jgi:hypothetical protein
VIRSCWLVDAVSSRRRVTSAVFVGVALAGHVVAFVAIGRRLGMGRVEGLDVLDFVLHPRWEPGLPPALLLAGMIVAAAGVAAIVIPSVLRDSEPLPHPVAAGAGPESDRG